MIWKLLNFNVVSYLLSIYQDFIALVSFADYNIMNEETAVLQGRHIHFIFSSINSEVLYMVFVGNPE